MFMLYLYFLSLRNEFGYEGLAIAAGAGVIMEDCGPILTDCTLIKTLEQAGPQLFWEMSLSRCTLFRTLFRVPPFSEMLFFLLTSESTLILLILFNVQGLLVFNFIYY